VCGRGQTPPGTIESDAESLTVEWLEQEIESLHLERLHGISIVGRDEHDLWRTLSTDAAQYLETVEERHLNVEKQNVGTLSSDRRKCLAAVGRFRHGDHVRFIEKIAAQLATREWLIVQDQYAEASRALAGDRLELHPLCRRRDAIIRHGESAGDRGVPRAKWHMVVIRVSPVLEVLRDSAPWRTIGPDTLATNRPGLLKIRHSTRVILWFALNWPL
jgi:hypothetical protein